MKRYWFYGTMPTHTISESELSEEQKKIIENEKKKIDDDNFIYSWLGFKQNVGWDFMRHGLEVIHINEEKGNIARMKLVKIIEEKYKE